MRLLPTKLSSRTVLVLLAGLIVSNLVGLLIYTGERSLAVNNIAGDDVAERIAAVARTIDGLPSSEQNDVACTQSGTGFAVMVTPEPLVRANDGSTHTRRIFGVLSSLLGQPGNARLRMANIRNNEETATLSAFHEILNRCANPMAEMRGMKGMQNMNMSRGMVRAMQNWTNIGLLRVSYQLQDGLWVNFLTTPPQIGQIWNFRFLVAFLVMAIIVTALSVWAVRRLTEPLSRFAQASERLGRDMNAPDMAEDGPYEVSRAAAAFNSMQKQLRRLINDRTQMLAAVSHDLRTPITRLRLRAEFIEDDEQRDKMLSDLAQMEAMIAATLSFARLDSSEEPRIDLELAGLLQSICDDAAEIGQNVSYSGPPRVTYHGRPLALRRVFDNLIENAVNYGERAEVSLATKPDMIIVTINDIGPGIPEEAIDTVFEPFTRVETSRNRETGGVGLGLAVVRSIIRGHGGDVVLKNRDKGGLSAIVTLPVIAS